VYEFSSFHDKQHMNVKSSFSSSSAHKCKKFQTKIFWGVDCYYKHWWRRDVTVIIAINGIRNKVTENISLYYPFRALSVTNSRHQTNKMHTVVL